LDLQVANFNYLLTKSVSLALIQSKIIQEMDTVRQQKVSRLLQKELSVFFQQESQNYIPGGLITVTTVRISPDMGLARIYLSIFPSEKGDKTVALINEHTKSIRFHLGKILRYQLRIIPELAFYKDDSLDYAEKIDNLLG
jgi:ribosome-binding factor A